MDEDELKELAEFLYISHCETKPTALLGLDQFQEENYEHGPDRPHRLDVLNEVIQVFSKHAKAEGKRAFICLGGLDKLCDKDGDARNPMHRALFRLLTGTYEHDKLDPPLDMVLIAGRPNAPICFLSEELSSKKAKKLLVNEEKEYSRLSKTTRILKKWEKLKKIGWKERVQLAPKWGQHLDEVYRDKRSLELKKTESLFYEWLATHKPPEASGDQKPQTEGANMVHALWSNVNLTTMLYCCWRHYALQKYAGELSAINVNAFNHFIAGFERRFSRNEDAGTIAGIFQRFRGTDEDFPVNELKTDQKLYDLILTHLTLFALPVEPWVLMGCPMIYRHLLGLYASKFPKPLKPVETEAWRERVFVLKSLKIALDILMERNWIIQIHSSVRVERPDDNQIFLHRRFALHGRMREYIGHLMQINISDEGDINHHQISLYCDQPKDLPTPSPHHFEMVREILDNQQKRFRETLEIAYWFSPARYKNKLARWDGDGTQDKIRSERNARRAATRLFQPENVCAIDDTSHPVGFSAKEWKKLNESDQKTVRADWNWIGDDWNLGGYMGRIHAVSQRIRGSFSLVRSAFSVGSLSRMETAEPFENQAPPFDLYRGWIRGLLNAATGLHITSYELGRLLDGSFFPNEAPIEDLNDAATELNNLMEEKTSLNPSTIAKSAIKQLGLRELDEDGSDGDVLLVQTARDMIDVKRAADGSTGNPLNFTTRQQATFQRVRHPLYRDEIALNSP